MFDQDGKEITPIWYDRGAETVLVRYADGQTSSVRVVDITSPKGEAYIARVIRAVRVP